MARKLLLGCGILSSLLYAAMLVFVATQWESYSSFSQTVSELSAIGAPTRTLWVRLSILYTLLMAAFGSGVRLSAGSSRALRVAGAAMIVHGVLGLFWPPMHLRGDELTLTDTMHIVFTAATILLMMTAIAFAAAAFGKRFRIYSIATLAVLVAFGALAGIAGPRVAADLPTPWVGVWQRINIGVFLLWIIVLAVALLRAPTAAARP